jgi:hypothetical protein
MDKMNIALPESMKQFVQERVVEGGYSVKFAGIWRGFFAAIWHHQ